MNFKGPVNYDCVVQLPYRNMETTYATKKKKYEKLTWQIQRMWKTQDVRMVSIVVSSTGLVHKKLTENLKMMDLGDEILIDRM